jgi:polysaccharide biosynthesis/export protein
MRIVLPFLAVAAALISGCGGKPQLVSSEKVSVVSQGSLPAPTPADLAALDRPYLIGPFDKLKVDVFGVPELSNEVQADASGRISMPLIGSIDAAGKTPAELAQSIAGALRGQFVRNPQVTVNLKETVSQVVTVDGEVREPGLYPVIGRMSLMRAIAVAKGASEFARLDDVVVFRTVNNQRYAALYNLKAIRRGLYEDPEIYANDVVVVGDSQARRLFKDIIQGSSLITTPIIALLRI